MIGEEDALVRLNNDIATRETAGDRAWFENLLAPQFAMRRANFRPHHPRGVPRPCRSQRRTLHRRHRRGPPHRPHRRGHCTVTMRQDDDTWAAFRNVRLFTRDAPDHAWQLLAWANEPAGND